MARKDYYDDPKAPKATVLKPATSAIVTNERGEILLQQRTDNGLWGLPGGTMEPGESITECLIREVQEETGFNVDPVALIGLYSDPKHVLAYSDGEVRQQFSMCFFCIIQGGTLKVSDESFAVEFFSIGELNTLNIHPSILLRIQHYLEQKGTPYFS